MLHAATWILLSTMGSAFCVIINGGDEDDMPSDIEDCMVEPECIVCLNCCGMPLAALYLYFLVVLDSESAGWWICLVLCVDMCLSCGCLFKMIHKKYSKGQLFE